MSDINQMQFMRRWAAVNNTLTAEDPEPRLSPETASLIAQGILTMLGIVDVAWEAQAGRKLTEEEKWGTPSTAHRCPDCGQPVPNFFDHLTVDCL